MRFNIQFWPFSSKRPLEMARKSRWPSLWLSLRANGLAGGIVIMGQNKGCMGQPGERASERRRPRVAMGAGALIRPIERLARFV